MNEIERILTGKGRFRIDLGLEGIEKILDCYNHPEKNLKCFHIAGTNGKGSTAAILEEILIQKGNLKIGKYVSPHLFNYTERITVNKTPIDENELKKVLEDIEKKDEELKLNLTEFEFLTAAAFIYFNKENVDFVILETGMGGRFDATNIIKNPICSIITSVSFDHKERLGDTIEKIGFEKAGILKNGAFCTFLKENNAYNTLLKEAEIKGAKLIQDDIKVEVEKGFAFINNEKTEFGLIGDFQRENLKLALLSLKALPFEIEKNVIKKALKNTVWKFRMEKLNFKGKNLLLDGCHNPDGARVLNDYLTKYQNDKKIKFIFGCLKNKEWRKILTTLHKNKYDFCFYEFDYPNVLKYEELEEFKDKLREIKNPIEEINKNDFDLCVVSGSLYMLGKIFKNIL